MAWLGRVISHVITAIWLYVIALYLWAAWFGRVISHVIMHFCYLIIFLIKMFFCLYVRFCFLEENVLLCSWRHVHLSYSRQDIVPPPYLFYGQAKPGSGFVDTVSRFVWRRPYLFHRPDLDTIILGEASTSQPTFPSVRVFGIAHSGIRRSRPLCLVARKQFF